jgi:type IV pilus assembly protein PilF
MIRILPIFQREPPPAGSALGSTANPPAGAAKGAAAGAVQLGKLFSAFCLALAISGCAHIVTDKDREQAQIHYDLAVQNLVKQPQIAFQETDEALTLNPEMADAWHVRGLLLHHSFKRYDEALAAYMKCLELKPDFSEARTNLGNLYIDMKRYDDAIAQYDKALNDVLYGAPFIAHGNMGWAYYKKGDMAQALDHLKAAITLNPKYCLGHLKLGQLYEEQQNGEESCKYFGRFREYCPERADAWQYDGLCHAKKGEIEEAKKSFDTCLEKATSDDQKDLCKQLKGQLAP